MELLRVVFRDYRWPFIGVMLLSLASAGLGVGVIAFINQRMIADTASALTALPGFIGLLVLLLAISLGAQLALTMLGHWFVYHLRGRLIKRMLDTPIERLEQLGSAHLLASLSSDVRNVTIAFVRLPELVQGVVLTVATAVYLGYLSAPMLAVTALWITLTMLIGWWLVSRVYHHLNLVRESEDRLYQNYEAVIGGRKELSLNRYRARRLYGGSFDAASRDYRHHVICADTFHLSANNWANIMMLGAIGVAFYLANGLGWANTTVAATYALALLFLRTPLIGAVGALPTLLSAQVAFNKLESLRLAEDREGFDIADASADWQCIELRGVSFRYAPLGDKPGFAVGPLDLTVHRGEQIFLIGGNGSGKSTLARLLSGLYHPQSGEILVDGTVIDDRRWEAYRQRFASVFTDFHLFDQLLGPHGGAADPALVEAWLERLNMREKLEFVDQRVTSRQLSQGQRKRLALLVAICEQRDILLLDEWAADQDPTFRRVFYRELLPAMRAQGLTVFAISHDDSYFEHADRLLEMRDGQLSELTGEQRANASRDAVSRIG